MSQPKKPTCRHGSKVLTKNARRAFQKNCEQYKYMQSLKKAIGKIISKPRPFPKLEDIVTITPIV